MSNKYFFDSRCKRLNTFFKQLRKRHNEMYMKYIYKKDVYEQFLESNGNLQIIGDGYILNMGYDTQHEIYYFSLFEKEM